MSPQSLNRYAYAANNPLKNADPSGEFLEALFGAIVGAIIGAVAYTVTTLVSGQAWDWGAFGRSVAVGAIAGAITATCGICGSGLWANVAGGAAIGAGIGAVGYAADRGIEYLQTGTLEWDWGQFGLSVGIGAAAGAAGGYLRWRSLQKPTATPVKGASTSESIDPPGTQGGGSGVPTNGWGLRQAGDNEFVWRVSGGKSPIEGKWWSRYRAGSGIEAGGLFNLRGTNAATRISYGQIQPGSYYLERMIAGGITEIYVPDSAFVTVFGTVRLPWV